MCITINFSRLWQAIMDKSGREFFHRVEIFFFESRFFSSSRKFFPRVENLFFRVENFFIESRILSSRREFLPRVENIFAELRIISSSRILTTSREFFHRVEILIFESRIFSSSREYPTCHAVVCRQNDHVMYSTQNGCWRWSKLSIKTHNFTNSRPHR